LIESSDRPPIAAELRRRVLVEAGHRCAIPTCRYIEVDVHHIIPWAQCQAHEYDNLIALCPNCHRRADRGDIDRKSLRLYKINLRFAHDKFSQLEIDVLFELYGLTPEKGLPWMQTLLILLKRIVDAGYVNVIEQQGGMWLGGIKQTNDWLAITAKGRAFIDELGVIEL
jgi:hypothetical protein